MAARRDIPGYTFDAQKGKYFKIQPDHQAVQGAHSRSTVNANLQATAVARTLTNRRDREKRGRIRVDRSSYTNLSLQVRHGGYNGADLMARHYAASLTSRTAMSKDLLAAIAIAPKAELYCAMTDDVQGATSFELSNLEPPYLHIPSVVWTQSHNGARRPRIGLVAAGGDHLAAYIGPAFLSLDVHRRRAPDIMDGFTENIWDIASTPTEYGALPKVALATSNGLWVDDMTYSTFRPRSDRGWPQGEQMTVAFQDTNVVMSGQRSGRVSLTDTRAPGSVYRIRHSSSVNGITTARTNNHIIVSGLQSTAMYDLRYTKEFDNIVLKRPKRRARGQTPMPSSNPFVSFNVPEDRMSSHYGRGKQLAYISSHDIAVVANCRNPARGGGELNKVTLYHVSLGKILPGPLTHSRCFPEILDIKVGRVRDGLESVFVATDRRLFEWNVDLVEVGHQGHI